MIASGSAETLESFLSALEIDQSRLTERVGSVAASQKQIRHQMLNPIFSIKRHCKWLDMLEGLCVLHVGGADRHYRAA